MRYNTGMFTWVVVMSAQEVIGFLDQESAQAWIDERELTGKVPVEIQFPGGFL
jgi:hypothetical protein